MTEKELESHFNRKQIAWLAKNGTTPSHATEEQILASYAQQLYRANQFGDSEKDMEHLLNLIAKPKNVYSTKGIFEAAMPGMKADSTSINEFIEDWSKGNIDSEAPGRLYFKYGPNAMANADKVMKQAAEDKKASKPKVGTAAKILGTVFAPRSLESWEAGKDASWKDIGLDAAENVLMLAPFAGWAGVGAKAMRLGKAGKVIGTALANAAVPHAMEALDANIYTPEENLDRSVYNEADAALGTATNIGAPFVLGRTLGRLGRFIGNAKEGTAGAKGLSDVTVEVVDNLKNSNNWKEPTEEALRAVREHNIASTAKANAAAKNVSEETVEKYNQNLKKMMDAREAVKPAEEIIQAGIFGDGKYNGQYISKNTFDAAQYAASAAKKDFFDAKKVLDNISPIQQEIIRVEDKYAKTNAAKDYVEAGLLQKRAEDLERKSNGMGKSVAELLKDNNKSEIGDILDFSKQLEDADWFDKLHFQNPTKAKALDWGQQSLESWAVNKYGSKRDATPVLGGVSNLVQSVAPGLDIQKSLQEHRKENVETEREKLKKSVADKVIGGLDKGELTPDDTKYLEIIRKNPDVLKGMKEGNTPGFRNWYLLRGSDILRGTELYRPTFEVE
jgi:hypothetical protein